MNAAVTHEKQTFLATYDWAKSWHDLPWAHDEPTLFLPEIAANRRARGRMGRALDIGCGAGTDSVWLAKQGFEVTSLDFMPKALAFTQERAREAGVSVRPVEADVSTWEPDGPYDLVLDHGLLHNMDPVRHAAYRERILKALADDGDFVLLHWHPLFPDQPDGRMGPRRVSREQIREFFAPDLQERFFAREEYEDLPDMVGGGMTQAYYWFRRNPAWHRPGELLDQIRRTLGRHGIDADARLRELGAGAANPPLAAPHLARIVGPGRLGMSHVVPEPEAASGVLQRWATHAGIGAREAANLLALFGAPAFANVCNAANPRCAECEAVFCKRLRFR